jgi:hypothetical protein
VPDGWVPAETRSTTFEITAGGAVVEDVLMTDGADVVVKAENVTIRTFKLEGGSIVIRYAGKCYPGLVVEDTTFEPEPGQPYGPGDATIASGGFTVSPPDVSSCTSAARATEAQIAARSPSRILRLHHRRHVPGRLRGLALERLPGVRRATFKNNTIIFGTHRGT